MKVPITKVLAIASIAAILSMTAMPIAAMAASDSTAATNHDSNVSSSEVRQALQYTPGVLEESSTTKTTSDSDSAINAATAGATVDIPRDASDGITIGDSKNSAKLDITLPNAENSSDSSNVANGVVTYDSNNGSANAVQAQNDGSVRMLTVIDNPSAPTTYDYGVSVPSGGRIELASDGGAVVLDGNNQPIAFVKAPWAKDAVGKRISTWFTTDGSVLTQHVRHNVRGVVYPVVADPSFTDILRMIWNGALGCVGGKEIVSKGVRYFVSKGGTWLVLSKLGTKFVPYVGWVSCGYGAWVGVRY